MRTLYELRDKLIVAGMHFQCTRITNEYMPDNPNADAAEELAEEMLDDAARAYVKYLITMKAEDFGTH